MTMLAIRPVAFALAAGTAVISASVLAQQSTSPRLDVHYVPTPQVVVDRMLDMAKVTAEDFVIDLGSGDGRIVVTAARKFGARGMGVDLDPTRIQDARANAKKNGVEDKVTFVQQNLFDTKISDASVVTMYLLQRLNIELRPRLLDVLKPGTRVASHDFSMGDWTPDRHDSLENREAYLWIIPAKVEGTWKVEDGAESFSVYIKQKYQMIEGAAHFERTRVPLRETGLRGADIHFTVERSYGNIKQYHGRVDGNRIEAAPGSPSKWHATRS
jgi:ubiquinone/menaquinone biosynthesis C-methylase UbiE